MHNKACLLCQVPVQAALNQTFQNLLIHLFVASEDELIIIGSIALAEQTSTVSDSQKLLQLAETVEQCCLVPKALWRRYDYHMTLTNDILHTNLNLSVVEKINT